MRILIILFLLTITTVSAIGCRSRTDELNDVLSTAQQVVDQQPGKPKIFPSSNGQFELTLDDKWASVKDPVANSLIQAENLATRITVTAFRHTKQELGGSPTLDIYAKSMQLQFMMGAGEHKNEMTDPVTGKLGEFETREFDAKISSNTSRVKFKFVTFKTANYYYKLVITGPAGYYDVHATKVRPLLDSFRETLEKNDRRKKDNG